MADKTNIEWTDASWTPIRARRRGDGKTGWHCEHITTGCEHCYAERLNNRLGTGLPFKPGHRRDIKIFLDEKMLLAPLRWRKPRVIFVCSMTDLFADFALDEWIDRVFAVMALAPQHTFQVLTKRAKRMREYLTPDRRDAWSRAGDPLGDWAPLSPQEYYNQAHIFESVPTLQGRRCISVFSRWPLPNVWLGISAERQQEADERIPHLLATPAAVRFVSAEPLLGPVDLTNYLVGHELHGVDLSRDVGSKVGACIGWTPPLNWVIAGGESGPRARPMHPDWARSLRDQCADAGVPFFLKQNGEYLMAGDAMLRVGKKAAGRLLDGREHNAMPSVHGGER